ncbi:MAG: aldehyde dehydrogenase family protein [Burkholderiaceae bacterium]
MDDAAQAARNAFPAWAAMDGDARKKLLHRIADAIVARADDIAVAESWDTGQPIRFMAKAALRWSWRAPLLSASPLSGHPCMCCCATSAKASSQLGVSFNASI